MLIITISVVISLGYDTVYKSDILELKNLRISTYSGNNTRLSYIGMHSMLSALKGYVLSWYTEQPSEVVDSSQTSYYPNIKIYDSYWAAQIITINNDGVLSKVSLKLNGVGSPSTDITVEIRGVSNGVPDSNIYASASISGVSDLLWYDAIFSDPPNVSAGEQYAIVVYTSGGDKRNYYAWMYEDSDVYSGGYLLTSSDGGATWSTSSYDFTFYVYVKTPSPVTSFQIQFDYSINSKYTVAYEGDVGRELDTFNYSINIYHNVDTNQSWVLAYSVSYVNISSFSNEHYVSPWIQMLSGSYTEDYHNYYWKIEIVVDAYDTITGSTLSKSSYVILTDQFYWQSYADFNGLTELVDTNMNVETVIQPYSIILVIIIILTYFIVNKRMMERD